jgi:chemotaxis signal transduction protein
MSIASSPTATASTEAALRHYCSFWIGDHLFGIDILDVKEINGDISLTPIFHAPPQVRGYVNIRGQVHLVVDPRRPLGLEPDPALTGKMLIIFKPSVGEACAMLVDRVGDIVEVPEANFEEETVDPIGETTLTAGVCKLDGQLLVVLDPRGFFRYGA